MTAEYNKQNPFLAFIKERYSLTKPGSKKNTQHIILDINGSGLTYRVGDSVGIYGRHDPDLIQKTLRAMNATGNEVIQVKQTGERLPLHEFLEARASITYISPKLLREVHHRQKDPDKKHLLDELLQEERRDQLKAYLEKHEVWDFLLAHAEVSFSPQELADLLMPLLPRFYSIASAQKYVGDEIHLTVAPLEYESNGHKRRGVCTHFLCELAPLHERVVPIFIQPSHGFHLPEDHEIPIVMIGPGTGIAPFRAFLQERLLHHKTKSKHWLFFGEWNKDYDFFYEEDWLHFDQHGHLRIELAFSRDQAHKVYVQHKMEEHAAELFRWLEDGAYLYVCGDARRMAKDVEATLHKIIEECGSLDTAKAREYIKRLRQQKRYLRDVY